MGKGDEEEEEEEQRDGRIGERDLLDPRESSISSFTEYVC